MGGVVLFERSPRRAWRPPYAIHNGPLFAPRASAQSRPHVLAEDFRVTSFLVNALLEHYDHLDMGLHPSLQDVRPFLWHNYGQALPQFKLEVRYTSFVPLLDENLLLQGLSKSRRQEVRHGLKQDVRTWESDDPSELYRLYHSTFSRQGLALSSEDSRVVRTLVESLQQHGMLRIFYASDSQGHADSAAAMAIDSKRAYYLLGGNESRSHAGTMVLWHAFRALRDAGCREVDLEGVNSPQRGHFKLSFGGSLTPYFRVSLAPSDPCGVP